jgi:hypothetical protein
MITQTKISNKSVILQHVSTQLLDLWLIFEVGVAFKESPVQLNNLAKGQVLSGCFVESSGGLYKLL